MNDHPNAPGNEFGGPPDVRPDYQNSVQALSEPTLAVDLERAQLDHAIVTAHKFPRIYQNVVRRIKAQALFSEAAAENCIYSLPRGKKPIIGPSVGLSDIVASSWGNLRRSARHVYTDRREKKVICEGAFLDLETNSLTQVEVSRRISDKNGRLYNDDMVGVTIQAALAIAGRNVVLRAVPRAVWFPVFEDALRMVRGSEATLPERRDAAIKALMPFNIDPPRLLKYLGLEKIDDLGIEHMPSLRAMYQNLRDGSTVAEDYFDPRRMATQGFDAIGNPLSDDDDGFEADPKQAAQASAAGSKAPGIAAAAQEARAGAAVAQGAGRADPAAEAGASRSGATPEAGEGRDKAAPAADNAATESQAVATEAPATADGYLTYLRGWTAEAVANGHAKAAIHEKFQSERAMRADVLDEEQMHEAKRIKGEAEAAAEAKTKGG